MCWIRKRERLRPDSIPPVGCKVVRSCLVRESPACASGPGIHDLEVSQFVQEDVIDQEASNGGLGPLRPPTRSKLFAGLPPGQESSEAHPRRQRTHRDLAAAPHARVSEDPPAAASVLEVDASKPDPRFARKSHQNQLDIL